MAGAWQSPPHGPCITLCLLRARSRDLTLPPVGGEGGERSEPGGGLLLAPSKNSPPTPPAFASLRRSTLPANGREGKDRCASFNIALTFAARPHPVARWARSRRSASAFLDAKNGSRRLPIHPPRSGEG